MEGETKGGYKSILVCNADPIRNTIVFLSRGEKRKIQRHALPNFAAGALTHETKHCGRCRFVLLSITYIIGRFKIDPGCPVGYSWGETPSIRKPSLSGLSESTTKLQFSCPPAPPPSRVHQSVTLRLPKCLQDALAPGGEHLPAWATQAKPLSPFVMT